MFQSVASSGSVKKYEIGGFKLKIIRVATKLTFQRGFKAQNIIPQCKKVSYDHNDCQILKFSFRDFLVFLISYFI